jgi:lysophospholipase L1-like esterase
LLLALGLAGLAELALRVAGFESRVRSAPMLVWNAAEDELMASSAYLYRLDPDCLWSPRPGAVIQFGERERIGGPPEHVNADGLRGPRVPRARTPGVVRIATLGDSSTFGLGVTHAQSYPALLVDELARLGVRAEVLSAGVEGYTVVQGRQRWRHLVADWQPDVVVLAFGAVNEHWAADETDEEKLARLAGERAWARRWAASAREHLRVVQGLEHLADPGGAARRLAAAEEQRAIAQYLAGHAGNPQWPFRRRVKVADYQRVLAEFVREVRAAGARPIVVVPPRRRAAEVDLPVLRAYTRATMVAAADEGAQVLAAHTRFRAVEAEGGDHPWFIHDYWHPNAAGHARLAEWLAPMVVDPGLHVGRDAEMDRPAAPGAR